MSIANEDARLPTTSSCNRLHRNWLTLNMNDQVSRLQQNTQPALYTSAI